MRDILGGLKNCEFISDNITIKSSIAENQLSELDALADTIAADIVPAAPAAAEGKTQVLEVESSAFHKFTYGVELLTTRVGDKDYGCIINTAGQAASGNPRKVTISVIKKNHTCDMLLKSGKFNVSILTEDAPYSVFQQFGFQSGREVDKFAEADYDERLANGIRYLPRYTNAVLSCEVTDTKDLGASMLFIADVVEARKLSDGASCSYEYYQSHIKPKKNPAPAQKEGWVCKVCGYFYEGAVLPDDFICPLCKHGKEDFEHVVPAVVNKVKGYICTVCGYFQPCEGELPDDFVCPLCHHGKEAFEPAEQ
jgi:flavin reductase (DIM6/NTAB) family NADH-FMN oxidoreductase RutF/rubredoxin